MARTALALLLVASAALGMSPLQAQKKPSSPIQFELPSVGLSLPAAPVPQTLVPQQLQKRTARSIGASPTAPTPNVSTVELVDLYERGFFHWVGNESQTALLLTYSNSKKKFDFYRSEDYGSSSWTLRNDLFHGDSDISTLATSPVNTSHVIFEESDGSGIWSSTDAAASVTFHATAFSVARETLQFSPYMSKLVVVLDTNKQIYGSTDLGASWMALETPQGENIISSSFFWGNDLDDCDVVFVQHSDGHVYQIALASYPKAGSVTLLTGAIATPKPATFVLSYEYMFVEAFTNTVDLNLYVSFNRSSFTRAFFPGPPRTLDFVFVDASEHMAIVAVQHADNLSNLYISARHGLHFSLSLSNVLLVDQGGFVAVDFQRVLGLEGIYLASQLTPGAPGRQFFQTVITYNKGGAWDRIEAPDGSECDLPDCALNFHMQYSQADPRLRVPSVYSKPTAPGYILANGNLGPDLQFGGQSYFSANAGLSWSEASPLVSQFHMLDSGGVMVLGSSIYPDLASNITYSIDDGTTWQTVQLDEPVYIVAMLSQPGNRALDFIVAGVTKSITSWVITTISFLPVLPKKCTASDYYFWSPRDELDGLPCILGADVKVQRRLPSSFCHNGLSFVRNETSEPCECTGEDLECDFGFARDALTSPCLPVTDSLPLNCSSPGEKVSISRGYRLVSEDVCVHGVLDFLAPVTYVCPSYSDVPTTTTTTTVATTPSPTHAAASSSGSHSSVGLIAGLVIAMLLLVVSGVVIFMLLRRRSAQSEPVRYAPLESTEAKDERDEDMLAF